MYTGKLVQSIKTRNNYLNSFEFNPAEFLLAGASSDKTVFFLRHYCDIELNNNFKKLFLGKVLGPRNFRKGGPDSTKQTSCKCCDIQSGWNKFVCSKQWYAACLGLGALHRIEIDVNIC